MLDSKVPATLPLQNKALDILAAPAIPIPAIATLLLAKAPLPITLL